MGAKRTTKAGTRPVYPPEFRRRLVELARAGRSPEALAREFEPTAQSIVTRQPSLRLRRHPDFRTLSCLSSSRPPRYPLAATRAL